jgi:hypothetical protein
MDLPSPCPVCGAMSLAPAERTTTLLAVCDVLTLKALEALGKYIVRVEGARYRVLTSHGWPYTMAHTIWQAPDRMVDKALRGAWDVVPPVVSLHGCCDITAESVVCTLDEYVHDLAITGTPHRIDELAYRFDTRLGLPVREAVWT